MIENPRFIVEMARHDVRQKWAKIVAFIIEKQTCYAEYVQEESTETGTSCKHALARPALHHHPKTIVRCMPIATIGDSPFESSLTFRNRHLR